jgi:hypothetical protein
MHGRFLRHPSGAYEALIDDETFERGHSMIAAGARRPMCRDCQENGVTRSC